MAKETKELEPTIKKSQKKAVSSSKKASTAKSATKKTTTKSTTKKATAEKATETAVKKTTAKKAAKTATKKTTAKKATKTATKKTTAKKATETATKKTTAKKATKTTAKKTTAKKVTETAAKKTTKIVEKDLATKFQAEYYDLPYMYNKTVVKVLAQTPKMLFIYWEISEDDRTMLTKTYGEDFFNNTKPILVVYNDTMNYSFEVEIDDFANSWYLHINDANCDYHVELGRKPISHEVQYKRNHAYIPYYVYVTSSNEMSAPNNTILFNPNLKTIKFRNVKTGEVIEKDIMQFTFITNYGIFNVKELYKFLYPNESFEFENIVLGNTSSGALSSSGMFSSQFK